MTFFEDAGVESSVAMTYATTFVQNCIGGDTLEDLDKGDLREMGITALGNIKRILKHAKRVDKKDISLKYHDFGVGSGASSQIEGCLKTEDIKKEAEIIEIDLDEDSTGVQVSNHTQVEVEDSKEEQFTEMATRAGAEASTGTLAEDTGNEQLTDNGMHEETTRADSVSLNGSMPTIVSVEGAQEMETGIEVGVGVQEGLDNEEMMERSRTAKVIGQTRWLRKSSSKVTEIKFSGRSKRLMKTQYHKGADKVINKLTGGGEKKVVDYGAGNDDTDISDLSDVGYNAESEIRVKVPENKKTSRTEKNSRGKGEGQECNGERAAEGHGNTFGLTSKGHPRKRPPRVGEGRPRWERGEDGTWEKKAAVVGGQEKYWPRRRRHPTLR